MDENQMVWNEKVAEKLIKNLEKRRIEGSYAATATQAKEEVIAMITPGASEQTEIATILLDMIRLSSMYHRNGIDEKFATL